MTPRLAVPPDHARIELWWASLGAGLVVILCVVILMSLLFTFVCDIERHLRSAASEICGVAGQLGDAHLIASASGLIDQLGTELALTLAVLTGDGSEER